MIIAPQQENAIKRLYLVDFIRMLAFFAIINEHLLSFLYFDHYALPSPLPSLGLQYGLHFARIFAFSGFIILGLSFFLWGIQRKRMSWSMAIVFILGYLLFSSLDDLAIDDPRYIYWDIYPFLAVSCVLVQLTMPWVLKKQRHALVAALFSMAFLFIPFSSVLNLSEFPIAQQILIGACPQDFADWPLLPWIAWPLLFFSLGSQLTKPLAWQSYEAVAWPLAFSFCFADLNYFAKTPVLFGWSCYTFQPESMGTAAQLVCLLFAIRLAALPHGWPMLAPFSKAWINKKFFLAYFIHYPVIVSISGLIHSNGLLANTAFVGVLPLFALGCTEVLTRSVYKVFVYCSGFLHFKFLRSMNRWLRLYASSSKRSQ